MNEFNQPQITAPAPQPPKKKVWSAKKKEVIQMWQNLQNDLPIYMTPINNADGSSESYGEDGIRITGTWQFISSVLSHLKQILNMENQQTKLRLFFRGVDRNSGVQPDQNSFVFYVNLEPRGRGRPGRK